MVCSGSAFPRREVCFAQTQVEFRGPRCEGDVGRGSLVPYQEKRFGVYVNLEPASNSKEILRTLQASGCPRSATKYSSSSLVCMIEGSF